MPRKLLRSSEQPTTPPGVRSPRGAEKRTAASAHHSAAHRATTHHAAAHGRLRTAIGLTVSALIRMPALLLQDLTAVPDRTAANFRRPYIRDGTLRLTLPEDGAAHAVEKAAALSLRRCALALQLLDAVMGLLQRLVLHQHGLNQRINRVWRDPQALRDRGDCIRIARPAFQLGQPIEKVINQLAFLRCHQNSPSPSKAWLRCRRRSCRM
jgi:hypothetical protein